MSKDWTLPFTTKPDPMPLLLSGNGVRVVCGRAGPTGVSEHSHSELHIILLFRSSSYQVRWKTATGYRERQLLPGQVCVIPSNQLHRVHWEQEIDVVVFSLDPTFILKMTDKTTPPHAFEEIARYGERDLFIEQLGLALRNEVRHDRIPEALYVESLATVLATHLLRRYLIPGTSLEEVSGGLPPYKLRSAIDYIHECLEKDLTLAEIAQAVQMSPYHFARMFKKSTGLAPHQYVLQCRVERAKALLADDALPLVEIAGRVGFQNQSHFTTIFRKWAGVTPKAYRNTI
jgi:AraC family transcriptional regulator